MLNYCDVYFSELPSRYNNKFACYTKVYIVSNWSLEQQYKQEQLYDAESWSAFLRRINDVDVYSKDGSIKHYNSTEEYFNRYSSDKIIDDLFGIKKKLQNKE